MAQNRSKRTVAETVNNAINVMPAADNLKVANDLIRKNCGKPIPQANRLLPNLPPHSNAAAKPFTAISKKAIPKAQFATPKHVNVIMDTTYFGRSFGIIVLMDSISGKALSVSKVKYETNELYAKAIGSLKAKGIAIQSIVCDGRRGLPQMFADINIPVQLCQFHQVKTISRYLTRNPKTEAGKALWRLVLTLKSSSQSDFEHNLKTWFERYQSYLNERTINPETGKSHYTHQKLRSAYSSLKRNLDYLFAFEKYPDLDIPNTTNLLDGAFAGLKRHLACHQGMSKENKVRFIKDYFSVQDD